MKQMDCHLVHESLSAFVTGQSSPAEQQAVQAHLDECYLCQEAVAELRETWDLLGEWTTPAPHPLAVHRFRKAFRESLRAPARESVPAFERILKRHSFWVRGWQALSVPVFAVAIVLVFGGIIGLDPTPTLNTLRSPTYVSTTATASAIDNDEDKDSTLTQLPRLYEEARNADEGPFTVVNYESPSGAVNRTAEARPRKGRSYY